MRDTVCFVFRRSFMQSFHDTTYGKPSDTEVDVENELYLCQDIRIANSKISSLFLTLVTNFWQLLHA